ncbi:MAG: LuxR C-terminal-related transcriptional regulator [Planctomycetota bacterium]
MSNVPQASSAISCSSSLPEALAGLSALGAIWNSLTEDTGAVVLVLDRDGVVRWHNRVAAAAPPFAAALEQSATLRLHDFMDDEVADERLACVRRALDAGTTIPMDGWCWGQRRCTTLRPIPTLDGSPPSLVLNTCVPRSANEPDAETATRLRQEDRGVIEQLTDREVEVLTLIARGMTTQQIADELGRSVKTVEWHRLSLGNKLSVTNRVELAQIAIRSGLVCVD